jgi:hypothetical protein
MSDITTIQQLLDDLPKIDPNATAVNTRQLEPNTYVLILRGEQAVLLLEVIAQTLDAMMGAREVAAPAENTDPAGDERPAPADSVH